MRSAGQQLRELLAAPPITIVPGVTNAFDARLAQNAGFRALYATGAGIANALFGLPDIGLITMTEMAAAIRQIVEATSLPVIADADTGYGNHQNVIRTVQEFEHAGVAAIQLEDQVAPKRCGHFEGKSVVPARDMVEKIRAFHRARQSPELLLVARTDAIAVEGLERAIERANIYGEAGADVIFVEAPRTIQELQAVPRAVRFPCLANMVEGGVTPLQAASTLDAMGYKLVVHANVALRAAAKAVDAAFRQLLLDGSSIGFLDNLLSWEDRQNMVGLSSWQRLDQEIAAEAQHPC
jgi:2-methylisocitrate lyase-like PEP mutase family enzyme